MSELGVDYFKSPPRVEELDHAGRTTIIKRHKTQKKFPLRKKSG